MNPGKLDKYITFERSSSARNEFGEVTQSAWTKFGEAWADVRSKQGQESNQSNQLVARHFYSIRIRYRVDIRSTDRINYDGKYLYITSISNDVFGAPRNTITEILATESNV